MFKILNKTLRTGIVTVGHPDAPAVVSERFRGVPGHPFEQGFDLKLVPEKLAEPLRWPRPRRSGR